MIGRPMKTAPYGILRTSTAAMFGVLITIDATAMNETPPDEIDPPAARGAYAVQTTPDGDGIITSWIESGQSPGAVEIRFSRLSSDPDDSTKLVWSRMKVSDVHFICTLHAVHFMRLDFASRASTRSSTIVHLLFARTRYT